MTCSSFLTLETAVDKKSHQSQPATKVPVVRSFSFFINVTFQGQEQTLSLSVCVVIVLFAFVPASKSVLKKSKWISCLI